MSTEDLLNLIDTLESAKKDARSLAMHYEIDDRLKKLKAEVADRKKAAANRR